MGLTGWGWPIWSRDDSTMGGNRVPGARPAGPPRETVIAPRHTWMHAKSIRSQAIDRRMRSLPHRFSPRPTLGSTPLVLPPIMSPASVRTSMPDRSTAEAAPVRPSDHQRWLRPNYCVLRRRPYSLHLRQRARSGGRATRRQASLSHVVRSPSGSPWPTVQQRPTRFMQELRSPGTATAAYQLQSTSPDVVGHPAPPYANRQCVASCPKHRTRR